MPAEKKVRHGPFSRCGQVTTNLTNKTFWIFRATGLQWKMSRANAKWKDAFWIEMEPEDPLRINEIAGTNRYFSSTVFAVVDWFHARNPRYSLLSCMRSANRKLPIYRQVIDSVFHNWIAMAVCALALWLARRKAFGPLPSILRGVSGVLLPDLYHPQHSGSSDLVPASGMSWRLSA